MATVTLKTSAQKMPLVGFGTWKVPNESAADTVYNAIKSGYRLFDGAQDYGNEKECGEGVARAIKDGLVKREDVFITSKLWNAFHAKEHVKPMLKKSLADWGLEYFDLFLIHFPIAQKYVDPAVRYPPGIVNDVENNVAYFQNTPISETWGALEECVKEGLVKNIGISNFNAGLIRDLLSYANIPPAVLQIEHHPYLTQDPLVKYVQSQGIAITGYSSFGPQSYIELGNPRVKANGPLLTHDIVEKIAKGHGKSTAQVLLRWATQRNIAVIPKSNNQERLVANLKSDDFNLSDAEIKEISSLDLGFRFNDPADWPTPSPIF